MMPYLRGGTEAQLPSAFLQAPTNVNVVAGDPKALVKPANCLECGPHKGHVAAWNVLCFGVGEQNMPRPARRVGHACGDGSIMRRQNIGPAHSPMVTVAECLGNISEPVRIGISIVVDVGDDFAACRLPSDISGMTQTVVRRADKGGVILGCNRRRIIRGAVVD